MEFKKKKNEKKIKINPVKNKIKYAVYQLKMDLGR